VFEEAIKQMKRLQNSRMVNGDDKNDMEDMEDKHKKTIITKKKKKSKVC
jgi:hypothetical protein